MTVRTSTHIIADVTAIDPKALRREMDKEGVTPKALASEVGVSLSYMCDITAGRRRLKRNPVLVRRIADALNCRVASILTTEERAA